MAEQNEVAAEVLLREPQAEKLEKVAQYLQQRGVQVSSVGAASLSIRCSPQKFEEIFHTALKPTARGPAEGVFDYGGTGQGELAPESEVSIPEPIAEDVEDVYVQTSARYF